MKDNIVTVTIKGKKQIHFVVGHDIPKVDEMQLIALLEKAFEGSDTYLASFFTPALTAWVAGQIRSDFPPDVSDWIIDGHYAAEQKNMQLETEINDLRKDNQSLRIRMTEVTEHAQKVVESFKEDLRIQDMQHGERLTEIMDELSAANKELAEARNLLSVKGQEIIELKAKLFDMIVKQDVK